MIYKCGHCGFEGYCYGAPVLNGDKSFVTAPWCHKCERCERNDKLTLVKVRGGSRPGAGRPKKEPTIAVRVKVSLWEKFLKWMEKEKNDYT